MKLSNFKFLKEVPLNRYGDSKRIYAEVTYNTGYLWWKETGIKIVFKETPLNHRKFVDSGKYTPGFQVEEMYESYLAIKDL